MMNPRRSRIVAAAALAAIATTGMAWLRIGPVSAQTSAGPAAFVAQMQAIERRRVEALVKGEAAVTERLTADDYHLVSPYGTIDDKAAEIRSAGKGFYISLIPGPIAVRRAGPDAAILRYQIAAVVRLRAGLYEGHYWHTDYYERRRGQWQVVWSQSTEIKAPTPRPAPSPAPASGASKS
jgi:hypothetical protein